MDFYGGLAGIHFRCDLLVETAGDDQRKYLTFAWSQRSQAALEFGDLGLRQTSNAVFFQRHLNGIEQILVVERFNKEFHGSSLHGFDAHRDVAVRRDEENRNADVGLVQLTLKIDSADSRQSHVEDQTARNLRSVSREEFGRRSERFHWQADRSQQAPDGVPDGGIIVHNENYRSNSFSCRGHVVVPRLHLINPDLGRQPGFRYAADNHSPAYSGWFPSPIV